MVDRKQQMKSIFYGRSFRRRAFYFLIFFLAMMTLYDVTNLSIEYAGNPKQANMNMIFNDSMTFPNMTFCMSKRQAWSHFGVDTNVKEQLDKVETWGPNVESALANLTTKQEFMGSTWPPELVMTACKAISTLNLLERESVAQQAMRDINVFRNSSKQAKLRALVRNWMEAIRERNVSFAEFHSKAGWELLKRSLRTFERTSYNESDVFHLRPYVTWISNKWLCFQPIFTDNESFKPIEEQGDFFLMTVLHDNKTLAGKSECMTLDFHGRPTTTARGMEGKGRVKDGTTEELCVGMFHEVNVEIRAHYKMLENDDKSTECRLYDDEESETEFDCRSRCRMEMIRQMCECTPQTMQYLSDDKGLDRYPACDYEKCQVPENQNFTDQHCAVKCVPHCVQIRYQVALDQKGRSKNNPSFTRVSLVWGAFEYLDLEQTVTNKIRTNDDIRTKYVWSLWTFVAALGGSIGMWLGLSVLSLIQLITFLTERTAEKVKEKKVGKKSNAHHQAPPGHAQNPHKVSAATSEERKMSMNPFGGPVAINPFESPFPNSKREQEQPQNGNRPSDSETQFHNRAASP